MARGTNGALRQTAIFLGATITMLGLPTGMAPAQADDTAAWQQYRDPRYHFSLTYPAGWAVQTDTHRILIQSPDHAAFAMVENFKPVSDETAEDHVDDMPKTDAAILRQATVKDAYTLGDGKQSGANQPEKAVGKFTYQTENGPGEARVLCMVAPVGGLLFALGAEDSRFHDEQPRLVRILQSLRFDASAASTSGGGHGSSGGGAAATSGAPVGLDSVSDIHYTHWSDPRENAFSTDVPVGWKRDGGLCRVSPLDVRPTLLVRSPHDEMAVMLGDAAVDSYDLPSARWQSLGHPEGSSYSQNGVTRTILHFMPAQEFNHWYLSKFLSQAAADVQAGEDVDHSDIAEKGTESANANKQPGDPGQYLITEGETHFTCRSKLNGRQMEGVLISSTTRYINPMGQGNWKAVPNLYIWAAGSGEEARQKTAKAVFFHMLGTWKGNPQWAAENQRKANEYVRQMAVATAAYIRQKQAQMAMMARANAAASTTRRTSMVGDWHEKMMGDFRQKMAAKDDMRRQQVNGILNQTDVTDGSQSWKVGGGYSHYYHNGGTVIGTNSPDNPGPDFSPLSQY